MRKNWVDCKFEDILTLKNGFAFKSDKYTADGIPVIRISDINDAIVKSTSAKRVKAVKSYESYLVEFGDILIAMSGATTGKFGIYKEYNKAYQNQRVGNFKLHSDELIDKNFIYYLLYALRRQIEKDAYGGAQPNISSKKIEVMRVKLAPLLEQKSIVAKIEQLFSELDNGIANLKTAQAKLKIYRQAVLKKAFSGELTKDWREKQTNLPTAEELIEQIKQEREEHYKQQLEEWQAQKGDKNLAKPKRKVHGENIVGQDLPEGWVYCPIKNLSIVATGATPLRDNSEYWTNGSIPWIKSGALNQLFIKNADEYVTLKALNETNIKLFPKHTLLIALYGEGKTRGMCSELLIETTTNQAIAGIIQEGLETKTRAYLKQYLVKNYQDIRRKSSGGVQPNLNSDIIKNSLVPLCSLEEQSQIVQEIESRLSVCDKIEETIEAALSKSEALRQSILKKAFEGRLLSEAELEDIRNHPDYESAHELLARIKQEKSQASQPPPQKQTIKPVVSTDIHAGLIAKIIKAHQDNGYMEKLSHVKCEKIAHLVEYHIGVALGREPVKDAAGPDDYPHLKKVEHRALKVGYFSIQQQAIGHSYLAGRNIDKAIKKFEESIDVSQNNKVNDLINLVLKFDLEQSEIVATLYAAWNNLLLAGKDPDDEEIVYEARENWSSRKLTIERDRFFKALQWMRQKDISLVPRGAGLMVRKNS